MVMIEDSKEIQVVDKSAIDDAAFEDMEEDFLEVLAQLAGDRSLEKFRTEYEKLYKALKKSHEGEKRLMGKCRELNAETVANRAKVTTSQKLSNDDTQTIAELKEEKAQATENEVMAREKEHQTREKITALKRGINDLTKKIEHGSGLSIGQEKSVNELLKTKEELTKERDVQLQEIVKLREQLAQTYAEQQKLDQERAKTDEKIAELKKDITEKNKDADEERKKKDKVDRTLREAKLNLETRTNACKTIEDMIAAYKEDITKLEQKLKDLRVLNERSKKDYEVLTSRSHKLQHEFEQLSFVTEQLAAENTSRVNELKQKENEVDHLKKETQHVNKVREGIQKKIREIESKKAEIEGERDKLKDENNQLQSHLNEAYKKAEQDKKDIEQLTRNRDIFKKNAMKAETATRKQEELVKFHENSKKHLQQEIENFREEAKKQRKIIYQLEKERDQYIQKASDFTHQVLNDMEEVKKKEMKIFELKKKIAEAETKLKQQQNLYEAVRSDRNVYSKNLIESQAEIQEMAKKLKNMYHLISQLKEDIQSKENALIKSYFDNKKVEKDKEVLRNSLKKSKEQSRECKAFIGAQESEERKLLKIIAEADAERIRQKKELDQVISERDIIGTQFVRSKDELRQLYEKIKIQRSMLNKGETQYNQRLGDTALLKSEIRKLRGQKTVLQKKVADTDELRMETYNIQRELLRERTRCTALEEELLNPMNIHRWRKLEGSDPSTYEHIQKIHALQKRLITKNEEVEEKELLVQEKEKLYIELNHVLARQPGPEVAEQLQVYNSTLKEKNKQIKAMNQELYMYESQVSEYKYEIERIDKELLEVKKKYILQKKKEQKAQEREQVLAQVGQSMLNPSRMEGPSFSGGGFNFQASASLPL
ncbi:cilia- and flagella-associated protein 58-like isoform X1 [Mytilus trossulus]|uniref:cilia- and flagella-associated protein 58-like isoform X1 n=1 Tax=Mytilus trossulus TaxID=6551 RepID=UPI003004B4C5